MRKKLRVKQDDPEQSARFEETARVVEAATSVAEFEHVVTHVVSSIPKKKSDPTKGSDG